MAAGSRDGIVKEEITDLTVQFRLYPRTQFLDVDIWGRERLFRVDGRSVRGRKNIEEFLNDIIRGHVS